MKVLILDFETQTEDAFTTNITEVGAQLYEACAISSVPNAPVSLFPIEGKEVSRLCYEPDYPPQTPFIVDVTGITDEMLRAEGKGRRQVFEDELLPLVQEADICIAHKTSFDRTVLESTAARLDLQVPQKEWLCTLTNFNWPKKYTCHKLGHLAWEHDIDCKASSLHRAINDVHLLARLINQYDFKIVLAYARTPWVYLKGDVIEPWKDGGKQNGIAKKLGFSWENVKGLDKPKFPKTWVTRVKAGAVDALLASVYASESPFRVSQIEGLS